MACLLQSCGYFLPGTILRERKSKQIGEYVIDMVHSQQHEQRRIEKLYFREIVR